MGAVVDAAQTIADTVRTVLDPRHGPGRVGEKWTRVFEPYEEYWISSHGRVYSEKSEKILSPYSNETGKYPVVSLYHDGDKYQRLVHYLVAECLILDGPVPEDHVVHHEDEDGWNAHIENLRVMPADEHAALHDDLDEEEVETADESSFFEEVLEEDEAPF